MKKIKVQWFIRLWSKVPECFKSIFRKVPFSHHNIVQFTKASDSIPVMFLPTILPLLPSSPLHFFSFSFSHIQLRHTSSLIFIILWENLQMWEPYPPTLLSLHPQVVAFFFFLNTPFSFFKISRAILLAVITVTSGEYLPVT